MPTTTVDLDDIFGFDSPAEPQAESSSPMGEENGDAATPPAFSSPLVFDIETEPLPLDELKAMLTPFDESAVKLGRLKGPEKIAAKIAEEREKHETEFIEKAALSPLTGRILAIGYQSGGEAWIEAADDDEHASEVRLLHQFWDRYENCAAFGSRLVGFNVTNFDVPFIVRRSWYHRITVPPDVFDRGGRYLSRHFVDLLYLWKAGMQFSDPPHVNSKLETLARFFGVSKDRKDNEVTGATFHKFWRGTPAERDAAKQYLYADIWETSEIASRMGVLTL